MHDSPGPGRPTRKSRFTTAAIALGLLSTLPASALPRDKDRWIELTTPSFKIYSNSSRRNTEQIAHNLEQLRAVLGQLTRADVNSPLPTYVYVFSNEGRFTPYKPLYQGRPADLTGYFQARQHANYIAVNGSPGLNPTEIIYHELVHYILANNFPTVPLWFNEGLAEYYSTFEIVRDRARIGQPIVEHVHWLRRNSLIPLGQLFAIDNSSPEYNEGRRRGVFYAQSWALVHYLLLGNEERRGQVARYLELTVEGVGQDEAFTRAFATDYEHLEEELTSYLGRSTMPFFWSDVSPLPASSLTVRPIAYPEVLVRLGDLLVNLEGREADAAKHFEAALEKTPDDARALAGLGYLAERQDRHDEALTLYRRAIRAGGDDFLIQYRYADSLLENDRDDAESRKLARSALRRSIRSNPEFAPAWALLAYALTFETEPSEEAVRVAETAHKMLPSRVDVAHYLMAIYVHRGERDASRHLFDRYFAHQEDPEARDQARSMLLSLDIRRAQELIEAERTEEALELLETLRERAADSEERGIVEQNLRELRTLIAENQFVLRYNEAIRYLNDSDEASARAILENLVAESEGQRAEQARGLLDQAVEQMEREERRAEVRRASELLAEGRAEEALRVLEQVEALPGSDEKRWIDGQIAEIRRTVAHNRFIARYNEALRRYNAGDLHRACEILEELLPNLPKDSRKYREARKLLADARAKLRLRDG